MVPVSIYLGELTWNNAQINFFVSILVKSNPQIDCGVESRVWKQLALENR